MGVEGWGAMGSVFYLFYLSLRDRNRVKEGARKSEKEQTMDEKKKKEKKKKISPTSILQAASSLINDSLKFGTVPPMMSETLALAPTTLPAA